MWQFAIKQIIITFVVNLITYKMKITTKVLTLLALLFAACSKPEVAEPQQPEVEDSQSLSEVVVKIDNHYTRTAATIGSDNLLQLFWSEGDKLLLTDLTKAGEYTLKSGAGSSTAKFTGSLESDSKALYAAYPYDNVAIKGDKITFNIPTTQEHTTNKSANTGVKSPMYGSVGKDGTISMSAVVSAVKFDITLKEPHLIGSVTLTSKINCLAGSGTYTVATSKLVADDSKVVKLNYAKPTQGSSKDGWLTIYPTDFKATSDKVICDITTDKAEYRFCVAPAVKLSAGDVYTLTLAEESFERVESAENIGVGQYWTNYTQQEPTPEPGTVARGTIKYSDGKPAVGVSVSDGFSVVQTDNNGKYSLTPHQDAWYIFYSIPADCDVNTNSKGQPHFFTKYEPERFDYNFTVVRTSGGKQDSFSLFCFADPQCSSESNRNRFQRESVPHFKAHAAAKGVPCYGVTLGDIVSSGDSSNTNPQMPHMCEHMAKDKVGFPVFQTMGNHDYLYFNGSAPLEPDENSSTFNIKAQRLFEDIFGPINYSWNRGDAHIISMRDMLWNSNKSGGNYSLGFSDEQYEWLRQDLSFVPKDKLVILCVHIPLVNSTKTNVQKVISLLAQYNEAHIMAGHTHYTRNEPTLSKGVYEHVHGAVCGAWWHSNTNGDGTPNGYGVYDIVGNTIVNWYYQGVNTGLNDRDYQINLYRGNHRSGGQYEYFAQQHGDGVLLANVFNADSSWKVKVYEDGVYSGDMALIPYKKETPTEGTGIDNPTKPSVKSSQDWWAIGYLVGVKNRSRSNYFTSCFHLYKYTLKNKNASIRVEATDRFGRTYVQTQIIGDYDYSLMDKR